MKAAYIERHGGPDVLKFGDMPDPVADPGQVVIDVVAASVNGADWRVRAGLYSEGKFPLILGRDFSGIVAALGAGVEDLKVGDAVFGVLEAGREGAYAETYKARDTRDGRVVVLKSFNPNLFADPHTFQRFRREAEIVSRLDHPNVVRSLNEQHHRTEPYVVLEYVDGENLREHAPRLGTAVPIPTAIAAITTATM